jgi:hypothetical protein
MKTKYIPYQNQITEPKNQKKIEKWNKNDWRQNGMKWRVKRSERMGRNSDEKNEVEAECGEK